MARDTPAIALNAFAQAHAPLPEIPALAPVVALGKNEGFSFGCQTEGGIQYGSSINDVPYGADLISFTK
jgi:hypothetical protein